MAGLSEGFFAVCGMYPGTMRERAFLLSVQYGACVHGSVACYYRFINRIFQVSTRRRGTRGRLIGRAQLRVLT
ncbi:hypothetical protein QFZ91_000472 [Paraburkholderia sp. JPY419]